MGVEARCCPCHSAAHCWHMKRQPCLCHCHPCHGRCHCNCCRHLRHHRRCRCPLPLPSAIAVAHRRRPSPLSSLLHCCQPLLLPSPSPLPTAIAVSIIVRYCSCHLHWPSPSPLPSAISKSCCLDAARKIIQPIEANNAHLILFCLDSGRCTAQSRMTDQVSRGNDQHQRWAASGKQ